MKKIILTLGVTLIVITVFLVSGAGITAYAAQSALPGDTLYPVKTSLEQTRISMAADASDRAQLQMSFAERRLGEISGLIAEARFQEIPAATRDFENYINQAIAEVDVVAAADPEKAVVLTAQIAEALSGYNRALTSMLASVPEPVRVEMQRVLESSQENDAPVLRSTDVEIRGTLESITAGAWIVGGQTIFIHSSTEIQDNLAVGDFVKVHAAVNGDGDWVAREIEITDGEEQLANDNGNQNSNANSNANVNSNSNANGNDNSNVNVNSNTNNNDNSNANSNSDDNGNGNDDNGNDNGSDDNGNDNGSGGSNSNGSDDNGSDDNGSDDHGNGGGDDDSGYNKGGSDDGGKSGKNDDNSNDND